MHCLGAILSPGGASLDPKPYFNLTSSDAVKGLSSFVTQVQGNKAQVADVFTHCSCRQLSVCQVQGYLQYDKCRSNSRCNLPQLCCTCQSLTHAQQSHAAESTSLVRALNLSRRQSANARVKHEDAPHDDPGPAGNASAFSNGWGIGSCSYLRSCLGSWLRS